MTRDPVVIIGVVVVVFFVAVLFPRALALKTAAEELAAQPPLTSTHELRRRGLIP